MRQKNRFRAVVAITLVSAIAASLWFAAPVKALDITITEPSPRILGSNVTFKVTVSIADTELLPIEKVDLYIFQNATYTIDDTPHMATCTNLPLTATTKDYISAQTGGGAVSITATPSNWGYGYGYGYAVWEGTPSYFGYGYGYGYGAGAASIEYDVIWTSPSGWPEGGYKIEVKLTADGKTFTKPSSEFRLSAPVVEEEVAPPPPPPPTRTIEFNLMGSVSTYLITRDGELLEKIEATTEDGKLAVTIPTDTLLLDEEGDPLSEITVVEMEVPPVPPEYTNVIGLVYDLGPDGATLEPPITLTFTYDPSLIPEGVAEENLVIAMWDGEKWVELSPCTVDTVTHTISAPASHFTAFTVLAYARPATFIASDLSITPEEVGIGESVTISALIANTGDLSGTYKVTLKIDNVVVATKDVPLAGGASQKVTFTTSRDIAGTYTVNVDGLTGTFTVKAPPAPAAFVITGLSITPEEVGIGESVTISTLVTNTGDLSGTYKVTLKVDNVVVATEEVTLAGGASQKVTFTTSKDVTGTYAVNIDGLAGTFMVKVPPVVPPVVSPKPINWWLIGGIIAGVVIIGVIITLVVRRRRAY